MKKILIIITMTLSHLLCIMIGYLLAFNNENYCVTPIATSSQHEVLATDSEVQSAPIIEDLADTATNSTYYTIPEDDDKISQPTEEISPPAVETKPSYPVNTTPPTSVPPIADNPEVLPPTEDIESEYETDRDM